jgi:hypothetical protein
MNDIGVYGGTRKQQDLAMSVVEFCIAKMMPRMKTLDICVELADDMTDADGFCLAVDKREFNIEIDSSLKGDNFITALCHEMVHVKQYAKGELDVNGKFAYKSVEDYLNAWYEKEAYAMQETLCAEFLGK